MAGVARPDVGAAYPGAGDNHGFDAAIGDIAPGAHTIYAYALNMGAGGNVLLGSRGASVPAPPAHPDCAGISQQISATTGGIESLRRERATLNIKDPNDRERIAEIDALIADYNATLSTLQARATQLGCP